MLLICCTGKAGKANGDSLLRISCSEEITLVNGVRVRPYRTNGSSGREHVILPLQRMMQYSNAQHMTSSYVYIYIYFYVDDFRPHNRPMTPSAGREVKGEKKLDGPAVNLSYESIHFHQTNLEHAASIQTMQWLVLKARSGRRLPFRKIFV